VRGGGWVCIPNERGGKIGKRLLEGKLQQERLGRFWAFKGSVERSRAGRWKKDGAS